MVHFDAFSFILTCAGFLMLCIGMKKLAEAHRILKEGKP